MIINDRSNQPLLFFCKRTPYFFLFSPFYSNIFPNHPISLVGDGLVIDYPIQFPFSKHPIIIKQAALTIIVPFQYSSIWYINIDNLSFAKPWQKSVIYIIIISHYIILVLYQVAYIYIWDYIMAIIIPIDKNR